VQTSTKGRNTNGGAEMKSIGQHSLQVTNWIISLEGMPASEELYNKVARAHARARFQLAA
jgi:hypothetical protein